jgi:hypothetical protein
MAITGMFGIAFIAFQLNMSLYGSQLSTILFGFAGISASIRKGISPPQPSCAKIHQPYLLKFFSPLK